VIDLEERSRRLRLRLADRLEAGGQLTDPVWRTVVETVPRHPFVPEFWTLANGARRHVTAADPDWVDLAYTDDALATQMTDGVATSSSTAPGLMLVMLQALEVSSGQRVAEIATGTGYNAALLSERLGCERVFTKEVDADLAGLAQERLKGCGYTPLVVVGDGREGIPEGAPYDRLIATCEFSTVPYVWLEQVKPGGLIVCPVGSGTARLAVTGDGSAEGRFLPAASYFMAVRDTGTTGTAPHPGRPDEPTTHGTGLDLEVAARDDSFRFLVSLTVPGIAFASERNDEGQVIGVELWAPDGSWARAEHGAVSQAGPSRIWDAVEAAHALYTANGRPGRQRFGLTVTRHGQKVWLDSPDRPLDRENGAR
jgi:protein-L-isoaspartate O-methyltransferase